MNAITKKVSTISTAILLVFHLVISPVALTHNGNLDLNLTSINDNVTVNADVIVARGIIKRPRIPSPKRTLTPKERYPTPPPRSYIEAGVTKPAKWIVISRHCEKKAEEFCQGKRDTYYCRRKTRQECLLLQK